MKNLQILSVALIATLFFASCSSNDDGDSNNNEPVIGDYFPSTVGNLWTYNVESVNQEDSDLDYTTTDFMTVGAQTGNSFTLVANNNLTPAGGTMNAILADGTLAKGESTLSFSGNLELSEEFSNFSLSSISLQNVELYDLNASNNEVLSEFSNTLNEQFDLDGSMIPITINYALITKKISTSNSLTVDGESYSNVIKTKLILSLEVIAALDLLGTGNPSDYNLLPTQDVLIIENYFAENVGLIKSEANQSYVLNEGLVETLTSLSIDLGLPAESHVENTQELDSYLIAE